MDNLEAIYICVLLCPPVGEVLQILSSAMTLLRVCRVNAALTIQLFSQLFHFINATLLNQLLTLPKNARLCTPEWGHRLMRRLARVDAWAEKQGLELAAEAHLEKLKQVSSNYFASSRLFRLTISFLHHG